VTDTTTVSGAAYAQQAVMIPAALDPDDELLFRLLLSELPLLLLPLLDPLLELDEDLLEELFEGLELLSEELLSELDEGDDEDDDEDGEDDDRDDDPDEDDDEDEELEQQRHPGWNRRATSTPFVDDLEEPSAPP
jgi:hypothetical protein